MAEPVIQRDNVLVFDAETAGGLGPHTGMVTSVTALADGRLASASTDNTVRVWDASRGVCLGVLEHPGKVSSVTDLGGGWLASASHDKTVRVWDASSGVCLRVLEGHTSGVLSVTAWSTPQGEQRLASASYDETVRVWDASVEGPGVCLRVLEGHTSTVWSVTALGDGRLASASHDNTVRVWDLNTGFCLRVLKGHTEGVMSVTALGDGRLASASLDKTVRVWDASSGVCLRVLEGHTSGVLSVTAWSTPEGEQRLASASRDMTVRLWDAAPAAAAAAEAAWAGWTSNDLDKFDTVFGDEAKEFSCCPVCLKYVERTDGCMYIQGHNCSLHRGDYYHKDLYAKYKSDQGHIYWCTICGRIALEHHHYELGPALGAKASLLLPGGANPFSTDCKVTEGGGGLDEKLSRFRRLREYALELQKEVGKKTHTEAMNELVEEMWNAPLARKAVLKQIAATKKWNIDAALFPAPPPPPPEVVINFAAFPDIVQESGDATALVPTVLKKGRDAITLDDEVQVIQFHHVQPDGKVYHHENNYIGADTLTLLVGKFVGAWNTPTFGYCWETQQCKGRLWPAEIKPYVPAELYEDYKAKFNWCFRARQGGGGTRKQYCNNGWCGPKTRRGGQRSDGSKKNFFKEVTNAQCMLPPAAVAGGYKTRGSRKKGKKSRKTRGRRRYSRM